jgi:poly(3-hydroxybutyrate) depolymerase
LNPAVAMTRQSLEAWADVQRRALASLGVLRPEQPPTPRWATEGRDLPLRDSVHLRLYGAVEPGGPAVLVVTPQVNHSYIADFAPDQSLVRTLLACDMARVGVTDWQPPPERPYAIADSLDDILDCMDAMGGPVHLVGLCQGGWQCTMVAALHPERVASLTIAAAPIDAHAGQTGLHLFSLGLPLSFFEGLVAAGGGRAKGRLLAQGFDLLKPFERFAYHPASLFWGADVPGFLERFEALRNWYRLNKDIAGELYLEAVRDLFQRNLLVQNRFEVKGRRVHLPDISCPVRLVAGTRDHITPPEQVWALERHLRPGQSRRWLVDAGHIGVFAGRGSLATAWPQIAESWCEEGPKPDGRCCREP